MGYEDEKRRQNAKTPLFNIVLEKTVIKLGAISSGSTSSLSQA